MKTAELEGAALDWAVAKCEHPEWTERMTPANAAFVSHYSTDWSQGGPIIERLGGFELKNWLESKPDTRCEAHIHNYEGNWIQFGPTPLIASMRCYVASKLGDEVDVPEELE